MNKGQKTEQIFQWCKQLFAVALFGLSTAIALEAGSSVALPVAKLEDWHFDPETLQLDITLDAGTTPQYFYLAQPPRIVVDLPDTQLGYVPTQENYPGAIQSIRISQLNADVTRIVMDVAPGAFLDPDQLQLQPISATNPTRWILRPFMEGSNTLRQPLKYGSPSDELTPDIHNTQTPPAVSIPTDSSDLPPATYHQKPPKVSVPPLNRNNPSQLPNSVLPPASLPNQPGNLNNIPPLP